MAASSPSKKEQKSNHRSRSTREELTDDIIFMSILPRLSYKSLSKFKCVSKTWRKTIAEDAKFAHWQSVSPSPISCCALHAQCNGNKFLFFNTFDCPIGFNPLHRPLTCRNPDARCSRIVASSCGLVCILFTSISHQGITGYIYICNLATGEAKDIPVKPRPDFNIGLAFDPSIEPDCFQLVHTLYPAYSRKYSKASKVDYRFSVFSSKIGRWVLSKQTIIMERLTLKRTRPSPFGKPITLKNVVYWDCGEYLICFDPWKDVAGCIQLPKNEKDEDLEFIQELGTCNGCITCTRMDGRSIQVYVLIDRKVNVWEMRNEVNLDPVINSNPNLFMEFSDMIGKSSGGRFEDLFRFYEPFPYEGGTVLFFKVNTEKAELVFSYDLEAKTVAKFCEFQITNWRWDFDCEDHRIFSYHNSMVKIPPLCRPTSSMAIY